MDEAASRLRMQVDSKPEELDELDRRIIQMKIEREALKKETDTASKDRLEKLEHDLSDLEERANALTARWQAEKQKLGHAAELKRKLDEARNELAIAQRNGEFQKAGELAYGVIPGLEKELQAAEARDGSGAEAMVQEVVTPDNVAQVVSRWTAFRSTRCWKASATSCCAWKTNSPSGSSVRAMRFRPSRGRFAVLGPVCRTRTGRSARSCS